MNSERFASKQKFWGNTNLKLKMSGYDCLFSLLTYIYDSLPDQLVLELVDMVLNYEESSVLSEGTSNLLLRDLDQVMTQIDQNNMQGACNGMVTFIKATEQLASKSVMEVGAAMLLISEANQIKADLYCS